MTSQLTDFLAEGLAANRPASPNVPAGSIGIYYATDTGAKSMWDPSTSTWITLAGSAPSIAQIAVNAGASIQGVTFGAAPTNGNLLVAIVGGGLPGANTGWTKDARVDGGGSTFTNIFYKIAGAGESTTQNPVNSTNAYGMAIFEISANATPAGPFTNDTGGGTGPLTVTVPAFKTAGLLIGAAISDGSTNLPSSITGATGGATASGGSRSVQAFSNTAPAQSLGGDTITATWTSSSAHRLAAMFVG